MVTYLAAAKRIGLQVDSAKRCPRRCLLFDKLEFKSPRSTVGCIVYVQSINIYLYIFIHIYIHIHQTKTTVKLVPKQFTNYVALCGTTLWQQDVESPAKQYRFVGSTQRYVSSQDEVSQLGGQSTKVSFGMRCVEYWPDFPFRVRLCCGCFTLSALPKRTCQ